MVCMSTPYKNPKYMRYRILNFRKLTYIYCRGTSHRQAGSLPKSFIANWEVLGSTKALLGNLQRKVHPIPF